MRRIRVAVEVIAVRANGFRRRSGELAPKTARLTKLGRMRLPSSRSRDSTINRVDHDHGLRDSLWRRPSP